MCARVCARVYSVCTCVCVCACVCAHTSMSTTLETGHVFWHLNNKHLYKLGLIMSGTGHHSMTLKLYHTILQTCFSLHSVPNNDTITSNNGPPRHFKISGKRPLLPAGFPSLVLDTTVITSSLVGGSHISLLIAIYLIPSIVATLKELSMLRTPSKWPLSAEHLHWPTT